MNIEKTQKIEGKRVFFHCTRSKLILFLALALLMNAVPRSGMCIDGIDFGYCITSHGFPFISPLITGETHLIPGTEYQQIVTTRFPGLIINTLLAYVIISLVLLIPRKNKN